MSEKGMAIDFHKAIGRECRAGSDDYGYLTGWGGMPEYDNYVMDCLDGAGKFAEDNNIAWAFGKEGELFFYRLEECLYESTNATKAIMSCLLKYKDINP